MTNKDDGFDWRSIPNIRRTIDRLAELRANEDTSTQSLGNLYRPTSGQRIMLEVTVTDVDVAQAVFCSMFHEGAGLLPGMRVDAVTKMPGTQHQDREQSCEL